MVEFVFVLDLGDPGSLQFLELILLFLLLHHLWELKGFHAFFAGRAPLGLALGFDPTPRIVKLPSVTHDGDMG